MLFILGGQAECPAIDPVLRIRHRRQPRRHDTGERTIEEVEEHQVIDLRSWRKGGTRHIHLKAVLKAYKR